MRGKEISFCLFLIIYRQELKRCQTLTAACKEKLTMVVKRFQQQKKNYSAALRVSELFHSDVDNERKLNETELKGARNG